MNALESIRAWEAVERAAADAILEATAMSGDDARILARDIVRLTRKCADTIAHPVKPQPVGRRANGRPVYDSGDRNLVASE